MSVHTVEAIVPGIMEAGSFDGTPMQLRQAVLDQITTYPETHDQQDWISDCGTTACAAGWALLFADGGLPQGHGCWDVTRSAMKVLDLTPYDAMRLFHYTTNDQAVLALKFLANGDPVDWSYVGHRMPHRSDGDVDALITVNMSAFLGNAIK